MKYNSNGRKGLVDIEKQILGLWDSGNLVKDICSSLNIGRQTVHNYLRKNNRRRYLVHNYDESCFSIYTPESCYWAGFIAADGNINKRNEFCRIQLHIDDTKHLQKIYFLTKDNNIKISFDSRERNGKTFRYCRTDICSVKIINDLIKNFNITPKKSWTLQPPHKIPPNMIRHFIRGYFDGDGSIYWNKSNNCCTLSMCSSSKDILLWISENIKKYVDYEFAPKAFAFRKPKTVWYFRLTGAAAYKFFSWIYGESAENIRLDRKYQRYLSYINKQEALQ